MNDEDKQYINLDRAHRAKRLMEDEMLKEAVEALEEYYISQWRAARKLADREMWWHRINALGGVWEHLRAVVGSGKVAEEAIKLMRLSERAR